MIDKEKIRQAITLLLEGIGEDCSREGLKETPERIARMYEEIFAGMGQTPVEALGKTFQAAGSGIVLEKDIVFYSICEHHLLPFFGKAHVAYLPDGEVVGLSKLARTVEVYARRPQIQERLTAQVADALMECLRPQGVMVALEAEHMCMTMRGVKKPGAQTLTVVTRGRFGQEQHLQEEFWRMMGR